MSPTNRCWSCEATSAMAQENLVGFLHDRLRDLEEIPQVEAGPGYPLVMVG